MIDFGDLAVFDAAADIAARGLRPMHHSDADIVIAVDGDDTDLRVVDRILRGLLHRRHDVLVQDYDAGAARLTLCQRAHNGGGSHDDRERKNESHDGLLLSWQEAYHGMAFASGVR